MKNILGIFVFLLLIRNCFPQLNIIDPKATTPKATTSQSQIISVKLPFTAFEGNNNLVDNYLCYNGEFYYILAKKTSNPSIKNISFVLGETKESSIKTLRDLQDWMSNNPIKSSITVNMGGKKNTIVKTDEDVLSFTSSDITRIWLLDINQISYCINHLTTNTFPHQYKTSQSTISTPKFDQSDMYRGRGGSGSGSGSGSGEGTGLGPGTGGGHGGGVGYGTGSRGMINNINTTVNEEGQVCVEVHVTEEGNVISARVINTDRFRTTITNSTIQAKCIAQAKQARYKPGKEELRVIIFK